MAKSKTEEIKEPVENKEVIQEKTEVIEEKVEKKLDQAEKKIEKVTGERENIINYVPKPRVDDPEFDFKTWAKELNLKLDEILSHHKPKETPPTNKEEPKKEENKIAWYDKEII